MRDRGGSSASSTPGPTAPPTPPIPTIHSKLPGSPPRSILRRNSSGSTYNGKRVTIQSELDYRPPFYDNNSPNGFDTVLTPMSISPIKMEDRQGRQVEGNTEFQQYPIWNRSNFKPEEVVLQLCRYSSFRGHHWFRVQSMRKNIGFAKCRG